MGGSIIRYTFAIAFALAPASLYSQETYIENQAEEIKLLRSEVDELKAAVQRLLEERDQAKQTPDPTDGAETGEKPPGQQIETTNKISSPLVESGIKSLPEDEKLVEVENLLHAPQLVDLAGSDQTAGQRFWGAENSASFTPSFVFGNDSRSNLALSYDFYSRSFYDKDGNPSDDGEKIAQFAPRKTTVFAAINSPLGEENFLTLEEDDDLDFLGGTSVEVGFSMVRFEKRSFSNTKKAASKKILKDARGDCLIAKGFDSADCAGTDLVDYALGLDPAKIIDETRAKCSAEGQSSCKGEALIRFGFKGEALKKAKAQCKKKHKGSPEKCDGVKIKILKEDYLNQIISKAKPSCKIKSKKTSDAKNEKCSLEEYTDQLETLAFQKHPKAQPKKPKLAAELGNSFWREQDEKAVPIWGFGASVSYGDRDFSGFDGEPGFTTIETNNEGVRSLKPINLNLLDTTDKNLKFGFSRNEWLLKVNGFYNLGPIVPTGKNTLLGLQLQQKNEFRFLKGAGVQLCENTLVQDTQSIESCTEVFLEEPRKTIRTTLSGDLRFDFKFPRLPKMAAAPRYAHTFDDNSHTIDLPLYIASKKGDMGGGVRVRYNIGGVDLLDNPEPNSLEFSVFFSPFKWTPF
ncbi:MAG: hypothetical protein AAGL10_16400 [Pseudomonadota bacterium]